MKDDRLRKEFGEYFDGVATPDNITDDAKKYVATKKPLMPKLLKFACAAASCVLVFAVSLTFILNKTGNNADIAPDPPVSDASSGLYDDSSLTAQETDAYGVYSLNQSLKFISVLAYASNSHVKNCVAYYGENKEISFVKAEVSSVYGPNNYESQIYVEFDKDVYAPLRDYRNGQSGYYNGVEYFITQETADNGEPLFRLYFEYGAVKYYFNITSSDTAAYEKYLQMIIK